MKRNLNKLTETLADKGFRLLSLEKTGSFFQHSTEKISLIIDTDICELPDYQYIDYTTRQNSLIHSSDKVFRFLFTETDTPDDLLSEIDTFLNNEPDPEKISKFGRNRTEQDIDPSRPEATFEDHFIEAFESAKLNALHREFNHIDFEGVSRFVDYVLFTEYQKFAIELNGEAFHHPTIIGRKKYRSQLFKQNSLTADGFKVFRWSLRGMRDREKFIQDLKKFFGNPLQFIDRSNFKIKRSFKTFNLYKHQKDSLDYLDSLRKEGRDAFLIILPTGTGKTEIFLEDFKRQKEINPALKGLIIVPTRKLRRQTLERLDERLPHFTYTKDILDNYGRDICVQTSAYLMRHYFKLDREKYGYIVVDEAHHAMAGGLRKTLEHFHPKNLIGVTASPDRMDQQKLEVIFGEYESILSLEDAIENGLVPPVRCFRIKSNIDLSEVRFNGKEYVKSDLQTALLVPSRDRLIVDVLLKYFAGALADKQGVVFCVDIGHAQRMADLLNEHGLKAKAVSGRDRRASDEALALYAKKRIRFLCACDLLTEGWDSPQTSILVMARPTFSRVLYTQQLGRGTRTYPGKEALYVLDVVDSYGPKLQPMSLHALLGIPDYMPFDYVKKPKKDVSEIELTVLDGLYEGVRRIEPVNIFSFDRLYGDMLNEEQLARELFVSTGTVKSWIKKGEISPNAQFPFGRSMLSFFNPDQMEKIRQNKGLKEHTTETMKDDFFEFLEKRDYTFSYKIIFLLSFFKVANKRGEADLPNFIKNYRAFYNKLLSKHARNEKARNPYNKQEYLDNIKRLQRNMLENPFEKFERKRFVYHCKDLNYISFDSDLWSKITEKEKKTVLKQMTDDLKDYYRKQQIDIAEDDYSFLLSDEVVSEPNSTIKIIEFPKEDKKYKSHLPFYSLSIAAGNFLHSETQQDPEGWIDISKFSQKRIFDENMFISIVKGKSMEPRIPDGSYCIFSRETAGSRNGKIVLAQKLGLEDIDTGGNFTVKKYTSSKTADPETGWRHEKITLHPINSDYSDINIPKDEADNFSLIALLIEVLEIRN